MSDDPVTKLTVAAAALAFGVPERSLFRAVEKGRIPSSRRDGVTVVDPADVEASAARRAAAREGAVSIVPGNATASQNAPTAAAMSGSLPAAHGGVAVGSGRAIALPSAQDGALAARVFTDLDEGKTPVEIVRERELAPRLVLELSKHHDELRAMPRSGRPSITDEIADLKEGFAALRSEVEVATQGGTSRPSSRASRSVSITSRR